MASENTKLWDILGRTDPSATKGFTRGGGFKGTAIKPIWSFKRMTEEFGPCGTGWGIGSPEFQILPGADGETLVYCTASVWYEKKDQVVWGVGGDKVIAKFSSGAKSDDEAFKKAYTDAITNALKFIGVGADVHMGLFDDSKYVNEMRQEFAEEQPPAEKAKRQVGFSADGNRTAYAMKQEKAWEPFERELAECTTIPALKKFGLAWSTKVEADKWPEGWKTLAREEIEKRKDAILNPKTTPDNDEFGDPILPGQNGYVDNFRAG